MIYIKTTVIVYAIFLLLISPQLSGQTVNSKTQNFGHPFVRYYSPKEYKSGNSNWCIIQDKRGVMYFGNETGILEFDGNTWRHIAVPGSGLVRALGIDDNGVIYVCASSEFGYLEPDSTGELKFKSLAPYLSPKYKTTKEIWDVAANSGGVYFKTGDEIFRWNGKQITVIDTVFSFRLYKINDNIYARNEGTGLMQIDGDSIKLIEGGEYFKNLGVFDMLPYKGGESQQSLSGNDQLLLTTNGDGLFIYNGKEFTSFKTGADKYLIDNQIYNATILADGNYALATQRGGVAIIDMQGNLLKIINSESGLQTNVVYDVYADKEGGLWLATGNGIAHCEVPSPFLIYADQKVVNNFISFMLRFKDGLYAVNDMGILYLKDGSSTFKYITGLTKPGSHLINVDGKLLAATNWGVGIIENGNMKDLEGENAVSLLHQSKFYPEIIMAAHRGGFTIIQNQKNQNQFKSYRSSVKEEEMYSIVEEAPNSIFLLGVFGALIHIKDDVRKIITEPGYKLNYDRFTDENGLPGSSWSIYDINGKMRLISDIGVYRFSSETNGFIKDNIFDDILKDTTQSISQIEKSKNGALWILTEEGDNYELYNAILQPNGKYSGITYPEFRRLNLNTIYKMYIDYDSVLNKELLWISTDEGLVLYDPEIKQKGEKEFNTLIRRVRVENDSLIYDGYIPLNEKRELIVLSFSNNEIRFEFSAASYNKPSATQFQYFLEGNDDGWSQWSSESKKDYTNLPAGDYKFHVRARNIYGTIGTEDVFEFKILPPWYLSWYAYVFYVLLVMAGIYITDRIMRRKVIEKERNRSKLREAELIQKQAEELETVDKLVRVINNAGDLETLFTSLLKQTVGFIPQAEKAAVFLLDHKDNQFHIAFTTGYEIEKLSGIRFLPEELNRRYTENSEEIEKGIYVINNTFKLYGDEKLNEFSKAKSMLVMAVEWDNNLEAYVVFDSFAEKNAFNPSTARILHRFREHAVSAISKAQTLKTLQEKNEEIIKTQEQLVTQQKLASLGALTAGIAHEIKNPLNFVNNFAELSTELLDELSETVKEEKNCLPEEKYSAITELLMTLKDNTKKIHNHGHRADSIIKGMLLHSRGTSGEKVSTNINELLDQYVTLAYHGLSAQNIDFNIVIEKDYDESTGKINIVPQDVSRVFLNVINNACYAANEKKRKTNSNFIPTIKVSTKNLGDKVEVRIKDNGNGIPPSIRKNIFNPFYTTKPAGEGTGLGLSLSYDIIVKQNMGDIRFETEEGKYTEFIITLYKK